MKNHKVFVARVGQDDQEYGTTLVTLAKKGHLTINPGEGTVEDFSLKFHLAVLIEADSVCIDDLWWSSTTAHQIVAISSWLGLKFIDTDGEAVPVGSLKGY